jgi:translation initiation factor IF-1
LAGRNPRADHGDALDVAAVHAHRAGSGVVSVAVTGPRARDRDVIETDGTIIDGAHGIYKVRCELAGRPRFVLARASGRLTSSFIRLVVGDRVRVEITPFDLKRGRIMWRHR